MIINIVTILNPTSCRSRNQTVFTQALKLKAEDIKQYRRTHGWIAPGNYAVRNKYAEIVAYLKSKEHERWMRTHRRTHFEAEHFPASTISLNVH